MTRRHTRAERAAHVRAYHRSGLTQLAFAAQIVDDLPTEPHDVLMDVVVTEDAVYGALG